MNPHESEGGFMGENKSSLIPMTHESEYMYLCVLCRPLQMKNTMIRKELWNPRAALEEKELWNPRAGLEENLKKVL